MSSDKIENAIKVIVKLKKFYNLKTDISLAEKLGVSQSTLATWKSRGVIGYEEIIANCDNVDLNWLFRGEPLHNSETTDGSIEHTVKALEKSMEILQNNQDKIIRILDRIIGQTGTEIPEEEQIQKS